jgi:hypothetical protein
MQITIETISHLSQRYNTVGDWQWDKEGNLKIRVSETPSTGPFGSLIIGVHELVEAILCQRRGITTEMVDEFDLGYDAESDVEPGDNVECPCKAEHCFATGIERLLCSGLDVDWEPYEREIEDLTRLYAKMEKK